MRDILTTSMFLREIGRGRSFPSLGPEWKVSLLGDSRTYLARDILRRPATVTGRLTSGGNYPPDISATRTRQSSRYANYRRRALSARAPTCYAYLRIGACESAVMHRDL